jgi:malonate-semialdehyde dehydrogenase (acetylating) / methylmalonate-semialdehyde dehydrogenase
MSATAPAPQATGVRVLSNYVGGAWVASTSTELLDVTNPATGDVLARVPLSTKAELDEAARVARAAYEKWRKVSVIERTRWLYDIRQAFSERLDDIAASITREMGKTYPDAQAEVARSIENIEAACGVPSLMQGKILEGVATSVDAETIRQPVGVVGNIVPFNFPAMVPFWFLPYAVACGNAYVLKPSEQVPMTQVLMWEIMDQVGGLPPGVINLVNGAVDVVNAMLDSPDIDAISFVGSAKTARYIYSRAAENGKRVQALGGAKNHMIVMPDAVMDKTADNIIGSAFGAAGQRCMAGSVVVTVGDAKKPLFDELIPKVQALRVGDGMDKGVNVGPVVSCMARDRIKGMIEQGLGEGATLAVDGREPGLDPNGAFVGPTILDEVTPDMSVAKDEIFGPVLSVIHADSLEEAIRIVNANAYGNGTSIFTESGAAVRKYREDVEVGMIGVNVGVAAPVGFFPFTGWRGSFFGDMHAQAGDAVDFYTRKKTTTSRWFSGGPVGKFFVEHGDTH